MQFQFLVMISSIIETFRYCGLLQCIGRCFTSQFNAKHGEPLSLSLLIPPVLAEDSEFAIVRKTFNVLQEIVMKLKTLALMGFMFMAGCMGAAIVNPIIKPLIVPPAQAGAAPQKWEQLCVKPHGNNVAETIRELDEPRGWNNVMREYGKQGWELVSVNTLGQYHKIMTVCFKRPLN